MADTSPPTSQEATSETLASGRFQLRATGETARNYDFKSARPQSKTTNVVESIGHLIKSCLGGGVVAIHESYKECGLWTALCLNMVLGSAVTYCMYMLASSAQRMYGRVQVPSMTYPDLAEASLATGPWLKMRKYSKCFSMRRPKPHRAAPLTQVADVTSHAPVISPAPTPFHQNTAMRESLLGCRWSGVVAVLLWTNFAQVLLLIYLVDVIIIIDLFGACCVYQVVVARSIKQLVEGTESVADDGHPPIRVYILALLLPFVLLCMITTLKYLAPFSIVADFFIFTVAVATIYYGIKSTTLDPLEMPIFKSVPGVFEFIGVCVFSMEGVGVTLAIENNMTNPRKIALVLFAGMSVVIAMVTVVGFFGYWGFGEKSKSPITVNFPWDPFPIMLKVFMALMIYVTFALNFWIPFELLWYYIKRRHNPEKYWIWERVYRAAFVTGITLVAFTFPNVSKFIGLIGSFCLSNMGFIFPAFIELTMVWQDPGLGILCWRLWKAVLIILFGIVLCVVGTYTNTKELVMDVFYRHPSRFME